MLVIIVFKCILKCPTYNLFSIKKRLGIDEKKKHTQMLGILLDLQPSCNNNCSFSHSVKSSKESYDVGSFPILQMKIMRISNTTHLGNGGAKIQ